MNKKILMSLYLIFCVNILHSGVPNELSFQGVLLEQGKPVNGNKGMQFLIYNAQVSGDLLWDSGQVQVAVQDGVYNYILGSDFGNPITIDLYVNDSLYVEVKVGGTTIGGRTKLSSVPYSLMAQNLTYLRYLDSKVGLGLSNPQFTLDVNGDINFTGNLYKNGVLFGGGSGSLTFDQIYDNQPGVDRVINVDDKSIILKFIAEDISFKINYIGNNLPLFAIEKLT